MFIYSNSSISVMSRTSSSVAPLSVRPVTSAYGALTTDAVLEFDGRHLVVGTQDILRAMRSGYAILLLMLLLVELMKHWYGIIEVMSGLREIY